MKRQLFIALGFMLFIFTGAVEWSSCSTKKQAAVSTIAKDASSPATSPATETPAEPPFITAIKESIKGKEDLPAEEVFENIQILKGMPAKRVIPIMQMAFSKSLGVRCTHCHEFEKWASEAKPTKQVARDMWVMTRQINTELLAGIENLSSEQPVVNCTTCHRGEVKPVPNK